MLDFIPYVSTTCRFKIQPLTLVLKSNDLYFPRDNNLKNAVNTHATTSNSK